MASTDRIKLYIRRDAIKFDHDANPGRGEESEDEGLMNDRQGSSEDEFENERAPNTIRDDSISLMDKVKNYIRLYGKKNIFENKNLTKELSLNLQEEYIKFLGELYPGHDNQIENHIKNEHLRGIRKTPLELGLNWINLRETVTAEKILVALCNLGFGGVLNELLSDNMKEQWERLNLTGARSFARANSKEPVESLVGARSFARVNSKEPVESLEVETRSVNIPQGHDNQCLQSSCSPESDDSGCPRSSNQCAVANLADNTAALTIDCNEGARNLASIPPQGNFQEQFYARGFHYQSVPGHSIAGQNPTFTEVPRFLYSNSNMGSYPVSNPAMNIVPQAAANFVPPQFIPMNCYPPPCSFFPHGSSPPMMPLSVSSMSMLNNANVLQNFNQPIMNQECRIQSMASNQLDSNSNRAGSSIISQNPTLRREPFIIITHAMDALNEAERLQNYLWNNFKILSIIGRNMKNWGPDKITGECHQAICFVPILSPTYITNIGYGHVISNQIACQSDEEDHYGNLVRSIYTEYMTINFGRKSKVKPANIKSVTYAERRQLPAVLFPSWSLWDEVEDLALVIKGHLQ